MGYNTTYGPPRRMSDHLDELLRREETVRFATDNPHSLAYKLREAIYASQFHEKYEHYHKLGDWYTFRVKSDHVLCEYQHTRPMTLKEAKESEPEDATPDQSGLSEMQIPEAEDLMGVVNATLQRGDSYDELKFPNATLMATHLERLYNFAEGKGWSIITHGDEGITLTKREVPDEITYTPEE